MSEDWEVDQVSTSIQNLPIGFPVGRGRGTRKMTQPTPGIKAPSIGGGGDHNWDVGVKDTSSLPQSNGGGDQWQDEWNESPSETNNTSSKWSNKTSSWNNNSTSNENFNTSNFSNKTCYNCKQGGHMSRDCPTSNGSRGGSRSGGTGGGRECFKCHQEGHISRDCPNAGRSNTSQECYKCHEDGHMARDCPNSGGERGGGSSRECFKCHQEGHMSRECPNSGRSSNSQECFKCHQEGHISRDCPNSGRSGSQVCYNCKQEGHMSRDCSSGKSFSRANSFTQYSGGYGTRGKKSSFNQRKNEGDKPKREIYIPEEVNEESSLFQGISTGINFDKYDKIKVEVSGQDNYPPPINSFKEANLRPLLLKNIEKSKYTKPTPVQKYAIPIVLGGHDLMACAQTGSGKTAAFLVPILQALFDSNISSNAHQCPQTPQALIVTPTRELAIQINQECKKFAYDTILNSRVIYGGTSIHYQAQHIEQGTNILVATPGRLIDFLNSKRVSLEKIQFLVLDEADRMLDMGFETEIRKLNNDYDLPNCDKRRTLMFSATFPKQIQELAAEFLNSSYLFLTVGIVGAANTDVQQILYQVPQFEKRNKLVEILKEDPQTRTLVFVEQKRTADFIASFLSQTQVLATSIHGDRLQREREMALNDFKRGTMLVLVATGVASRGLDIRDVGHVINYDLPKEIDEYVHRIGRTGRVGNLGKATSFYDSSVDQPLAAHLVKILSEAQQEIPDWLEADAQLAPSTYSRNSSRGGFGGRDFRSRRNVPENIQPSTFQQPSSDWNSGPVQSSGDADEDWDK